MKIRPSLVSDFSILHRARTARPVFRFSHIVAQTMCFGAKTTFLGLGNEKCNLENGPQNSGMSNDIPQLLLCIVMLLVFLRNGNFHTEVRQNIVRQNILLQ